MASSRKARLGYMLGMLLWLAKALLPPIHWHAGVGDAQVCSFCLLYTSDAADDRYVV